MSGTACALALFQRALVAHRKAAGLSQQQMAERLGVRRQRISDLECEGHSPLLTSADEIAAFFGKPLHVFLAEGNKLLAQS